MHGRYNDGLTAASHDVLLRLDAAALHLSAGEADELAVWPLGDIRALDGGRFAHGDARLAVPEPGAAAAIRARLPRRRLVMPWRLLGLVIAAAAAVTLFFWQGLPLFARQVALLVPPSVEARTGQTVRTALVRQVGGGRVCTAPAGQAALGIVQLNLLRAGPPPRVPLVITVVDAPLLNAFALPGGHILLFRGLLDFMQNPNELAGVLAHEMGHSELRHPLQTFVKRATGAFAVGLLFGDIVGFSVVGALGEALLTGAYTREAETEADAFAVERLRAATIATVPVADFFARMEARSALLRGLPSHFSTHPADADRAALMRAVPGGGPALSELQWRALKGVCSQTALLGVPAVRPAAAP